MTTNSPLIRRVPSIDSNDPKYRNVLGAGGGYLDELDHGETPHEPDNRTWYGYLAGKLMALYACAHTLLRRVWSRLFAQTTATNQIRFYDRDEPYFEFTNFAPYAINWNDRTYPTAEHLFQAHKFMLNRPDIAERIRQLPSSRAALEEARRVRRLQRSDWFSVNIRVMDGVLEAKFTQHPLLRDMLLQTGSRELIEDSPVDSFWGCGRDGLGRNELGKALMRLRDKLRTRPMSTDDYLAPSDLLPHQSAQERLQALAEAPAGP